MSSGTLTVEQRAETLAKREQEISEKISGLLAEDAQLVEEARAQRVSELGKARVPASWAEKIKTLEARRHAIEREVESLEADREVVGQLRGEAERERDQERLAAALAEVEKARRKSLQEWERVIALVMSVVDAFHNRLVPAEREVEAIREKARAEGLLQVATIEERDAFLNPVRPFPVNVEALLGKLFQVAFDRDGAGVPVRNSSIADEERHLARLVPDLGELWRERVTLQGVQPFTEIASRGGSSR